MSLTLPKPEAGYSYDNEVETRRQIEAADDENLKRVGDVVLQPGQRVILTSPGGLRWALSVDDDGALSANPA